MQYSTQENLMYNKVQNLQDIERYLFNPQTVAKLYSDIGDTILYPIPRTLLATHTFYNKKQFSIKHSKWSYNTVSEVLEDYSSFDQAVKNKYILNDNINELIILHIARGFTIFDFAKKHAGYMSNASLALQTEQTHKIAVVKINDTTTVVITNKYSSEDIQAYYSLIPIVFNKDNLPESLIESFLLLASNEYEEVCNKIKTLYETIDLKDLKMQTIKTSLKEVVNNKAQLAQLENNIKSTQNNIDSYFRDIANQITKIKEYQYKKIAIMSVDQTEQIEQLINYLSTNKYIKDVVQVNINVIRLIIQTPVYFVEEELLAKYLDTKMSYIYDYENQYDTKLSTFLKEAFLEKKYMVMLEAYIDMDMKKLSNAISGSGTFEISQILNGKIYPVQPTDALLQPHLTYHNCFGSNKTYLFKAIQNNDIIGFVAQIIASCQNINFGDTTVCGKFLRDIATVGKNTNFIINTETNERLNFTEYLKTITPQKATKKQKPVPVPVEEDDDDDWLEEGEDN